MVHDDRARPVSGEIMSAAIMHGKTMRLRGIEDASDAQFETLSPAGKSAARASSPVNVAPMEGMGFLTQRAAAPKRGAKGGPAFWSVGLLAVVLVFWISGGHALVAKIGTPAPDKAPLRIAGVESRVEAHEGRDVLFVNGRAENHGDRALSLPPIEIAVTGNNGGVTRYQLGRRAAQLEPGARYAFSSRLEAPGGGVRTVSVAFAEEGN